jgi:uncharacterized Tic20 family protein
MNTTPTTEDRVWAVLAHLSALSFGMGILLPVVGWSDQRRKSNYASFQCLQALGYQSLGFTVWVLSFLVIIILVSIVVLATLRPAGENSQLQPGLVVLFISMFGFFAVYFVLPMIAAVACALGRDFRYPIMGDRLARYLRYESSQKSDDQIWLSEDHELRWVAAMGHFSILILLWGMLAPLTAWVLQGRENLFLKFQSIQTLVYQAITTMIYLIGGFLYLFGALFLVASLGGFAQPNMQTSPLGIVGVIIFGGSLLVSFVLILLVPLLHILGQWAGYRVLKGDNYRYPLVGRLVEKWISPHKVLMSEDNAPSLKGTQP